MSAGDLDEMHDDWRSNEYEGHYRRTLLDRYVAEADALGAKRIEGQILAALWMIIEMMPASAPQYTPMRDASGKIVGFR